MKGVRQEGIRVREYSEEKCEGWPAKRREWCGVRGKRSKERKRRRERRRE